MESEEIQTEEAPTSRRSKRLAALVPYAKLHNPPLPQAPPSNAPPRSNTSSKTSRKPTAKPTSRQAPMSKAKATNATRGKNSSAKKSSMTSVHPLSNQENEVDPNIFEDKQESDSQQDEPSVRDWTDLGLDSGDIEYEWNFPTGATTETEYLYIKDSSPNPLNTKTQRALDSLKTDEEKAAYLFKTVFDDIMVQAFQQRASKRFDKMVASSPRSLAHSSSSSSSNINLAHSREQIQANEPFSAASSTQSPNEGKPSLSELQSPIIPILQNLLENNVIEEENSVRMTRLGKIVEDRERFETKFFTYISVILCDLLAPTDELKGQWGPKNRLRATQSRSPLIRYLTSRGRHRDFAALLDLGEDAIAHEKLFDMINDRFQNIWTPQGCVTLGEMHVPFLRETKFPPQNSAKSRPNIPIDALVSEDQVVWWIRPQLEPMSRHTMTDTAIHAHNLLSYPRLLKSTVLLVDSPFGSIPLAKELQLRGRPFVLSSSHLQERLTSGLSTQQSRAILLKPAISPCSIGSIVILASRQETSDLQHRNHAIITNFGTTEYVTNAECGEPISCSFYEKHGGNVESLEKNVLALINKRESHSWRLGMIHWLFVLVAHNCWKWFNYATSSDLSFNEFCDILIQGLLAPEQKANLEFARLEVPLRHPNCDYHYASGKRICAHCTRSTTPWKCSCKGAYVHPACFEEWHAIKADPGHSA